MRLEASFTGMSEAKPIPGRELSVGTSAHGAAAMAASADLATRLLKAMAHETRLMILCLLAEEERTVAQLEDALDMRQPAVSQQLARLRGDDLVTTRREGKNIIYALASEEARAVTNLLCDLYLKKR